MRKWPSVWVYCYLFALACIAVVVIALKVAIAPVTAQEADDPAALKAQIAQKDQQIAALQQKAAPAQSLAQAKAYYAGTFKANKEQAQEACKAAGGHLWVMVTATATRPTVSVSCEF